MPVLPAASRVWPLLGEFELRELTEVELQLKSQNEVVESRALTSTRPHAAALKLPESTTKTQILSKRLLGLKHSTPLFPRLLAVKGHPSTTAVSGSSSNAVLAQTIDSHVLASLDVMILGRIRLEQDSLPHQPTSHSIPPLAGMACQRTAVLCVSSLLHIVERASELHARRVSALTPPALPWPPELQYMLTSPCTACSPQRSGLPLHAS